LIRDPSDGSDKEITPGANEINRVRAKTPAEGITSGLPNENPKDADRHERSRKWLADYRAGKFKPQGQTE
jgi:hypothetical protein